MKTLKFQIATPLDVVLDTEVRQINLPTKEGEITVLPDHIPLIATLKPGVIEIVDKDGNIDVMSLSGGFIEVLKNKVIILADRAERAEMLDETRAEEARKRAEDMLKDVRHEDTENFAQISASLAKEMARVKAAKRWRRIKGK